MNSSEQTPPSNGKMDMGKMIANLEALRVLTEERNKLGAEADECVFPQPYGWICYIGCLCFGFECLGKTCCYTCCNSYLCGQYGIEIRKETMVKYCGTCHLLRGHPILPKEDNVIESQPKK